MCGVSCIVGPGLTPASLDAMVAAQAHRGPDAQGVFVDRAAGVGLGHNRLSVIDLSPDGRQPMAGAGGTTQIILNGEIYNYLELREELRGYPFRSRSDTEVILAAYERWGVDCLRRFIGMFSLVIWDGAQQRLFAARDRFGVKPLFIAARPDGTLLLSSEIKALHAAGVPKAPDVTSWATYFRSGMYDHGTPTFWEHVRQVPPGGCLTWDSKSGLREWSWYDPVASTLAAGPDGRAETEVADELLALLEESVRLRFRADVPVGVCLSGGLDSSLLLALIRRTGAAGATQAFTFECGDERYDETPWVRRALDGWEGQWHLCRLDAADVPALALAVQRHQDEPFGGLPTLGMGLIHARARAEGVTVLLDGNGLDEAWGGYEYYARAASVDGSRAPVQGGRPVDTSAWLRPEFADRARPFTPAPPSGDAMRDLQLRDLRFAKIPRAMRFADRVSMMSSREVREPFLDHRIVELGLRQPAARKVRDGVGKWLPRQIAGALLPNGVAEAPKRPVQTPQREWLQGPLAGWADGCIEDGLSGWGRDWLDHDAVRDAWRCYRARGSDNSFHVWQWISLGLVQRAHA